MKNLFFLTFVFAVFLSGPSFSSDASGIEQRYQDSAILLASQIWEAAELGYQEEKSSRLLREFLIAENFEMQIANCL